MIGATSAATVNKKKRGRLTQCNAVSSSSFANKKTPRHNVGEFSFGKVNVVFYVRLNILAKSSAVNFSNVDVASSGRVHVFDNSEQIAALLLCTLEHLG